MDLYSILAQALFLTCATLASLGAVAVAARNFGRLRGLFTRPVLSLLAAVAGLQIITSSIAVAAFLLGRIEPETLGIFLGNWLLVGIAAATLPGALVVNADLSTGKTGNRELVAGVVFILAIAGGVIVFDHLAGGILEEGPMVSDFLHNPVALGLFLPFALVAAVVEEVIFRGGLQGLLERYLPIVRVPDPVSRRIAILATSAVWAFGHAGMVVPHGVKEAQIFATGLVLGWLRVQGGLRACVLAHLALNGTVVAVQLAGWLVTGNPAWNEV